MFGFEKKGTMVFVGENGSLDLVRGQSYFVLLEHHFFTRKVTAWIKNTSTGATTTCPYKNVHTFNLNWEK